MYKIINNRKSVPDLYAEKLLNEENIGNKEEIESDVNKFRNLLEESLNEVTSGKYKIESRNTYLNGQWLSMNKASFSERTNWNTGCDIGLLKFVGAKSVEIPNNFVSN